MNKGLQIRSHFISGPTDAARAAALGKWFIRSETGDNGAAGSTTLSGAGVGLTPG